jgi:DNA recombination protein RmuC
MLETILLIIGLIAGFIAGYFFGVYKISQSSDVSSQISTLSGLNAQIAEMKGKFSEIEKSRDKIEDEREKRIKEFMEGMHKLFKEQADKSIKSDEEKEKRIKDLMDSTKKFFEEEKKNSEGFLIQQGKSREEIEKKRDAQIADMNKMVSSFTRTVSGTKTRGMVGEEVLKQVLQNSIKAGVIVCNLNTDNGAVEFAWNLEDGKYIPIDSKLPDVFALFARYQDSEDESEQKDIKKDMIEKVKKEIKRVQKYQNLSNTIDNCILVVPEGILDIAPELVGLGKDDSVFVCSYKDVFPIAHVLNDQYIRLKEEGDIGQYKQIVKSLFQILEKISKKTDTIEKAVNQIKNANDNIKEEVIKGKRKDFEEVIPNVD